MARSLWDGSEGATGAEHGDDRAACGVIERRRGGRPHDDCSREGGDRAALAELYDRHARQMLSVAHRILGNRRDAEDLLHDVFIEAWHKAGSYDERRGSVRGWLLLRMRSRAIDRTRALAVAQQHGVVRAREEPRRDAADDAPDRAVDRSRARRALQALSEEQRTVVELAYFEGQTCAEIAARCEIPVGTVKSRLSAAVTNLRKILARDEGAR